MRLLAALSSARVCFVDRVLRLLAAAARRGAHAGEGRVHGQVLGDGDELRRHQPAGGVRVVCAEPLGLAPRLGGDLGEDVLGGLLLQLVEHVGAIVRRHLGDEPRRLLARHRLEDLGAQLLVEVLEEVGRPVGGEGAQQVGHPVPRDRLGDVREVRRVHLLGVRRHARRRLVQQGEDVRGEQRPEGALFLRMRWRHRVRPGGRAAARRGRGSVKLGGVPEANKAVGGGRR